jgi:hypothetical protein
MTPHEINDKDNFIMGWEPHSADFCDDIIRHFNSQPQERGATSLGVDLEIKNSFDLSFNSNQVPEDYFVFLQKCVDAYVEKYKFCNTDVAWTITEPPLIQKYLPDGGYYKWHCERGGYTNQINTRHLVFMTYLNDVTDAGETEFFYQKLKIEPKKGLTLIWPVDWMFTHRGIPSTTQEKMIVTGWFSFRTPDL